MAVDPLRHIDVFAPQAFGKRRVDVIGCGATGSRVVLSLAKLGVENIHVWDFDSIESHNVANQLFGEGDVGRPKVAALHDLVKQQTGTEIKVHEEKCTGQLPLGQIVFLLTDTMASRQEIWDKGLKLRPQVKLVVETRMDADNGRVYSFHPCKKPHINAWEKTLYSDEKAETSACGASITVGPTADMLAGMAVWQMVRWFAIQQGGEEELENEIIFSIRPPLLVSNKF